MSFDILKLLGRGFGRNEIDDARIHSLVSHVYGCVYRFTGLAKKTLTREERRLDNVVQRAKSNA